MGSGLCLWLFFHQFCNVPYNPSRDGHVSVPSFLQFCEFLSPHLLTWPFFQELWRCDTWACTVVSFNVTRLNCRPVMVHLLLTHFMQSHSKLLATASCPWLVYKCLYVYMVIYCVYHYIASTHNHCANKAGTRQYRSA